MVSGMNIAYISHLFVSLECYYVLTEPDGPPQDVTFALVAEVPSQVMFNFNPPREDLQNGLITQNRISCADHDRSSEPVSDNFPSNQTRPYTLMNLVPATLYDCSLSASTLVGFGVAAIVKVLTSK